MVVVAMENVRSGNPGSKTADKLRDIPVEVVLLGMIHVFQV
jgi:hypothetical protein